VTEFLRTTGCESYFFGFGLAVWLAISIVPYSSAFGRHVGNKRLEAASNNLRAQRVVLRGVIPLS
jgi:hypothetical protein